MRNGVFPIALIVLSMGFLSVEVSSAQRRQRVEDRRDARSEPAEATKEPAAEPATSQEATVDSLGLIVYPAQDQSQEQRAKDEEECLEWARGEMGEAAGGDTESDAEQGSSSTDDGARERGGREGLRGAVRGAAAGAVVDEVREPDLDDLDRDDIGDADSREEARKNLEKAVEDDHSAAEIGAVTGAVAGRSRARRQQTTADEQRAQATEQEAAMASDATTDDLRKAVKACLEARGYSVE